MDAAEPKAANDVELSSPRAAADKYAIDALPSVDNLRAFGTIGAEGMRAFAAEALARATGQSPGGIVRLVDLRFGANSLGNTGAVELARCLNGRCLPCLARLELHQNGIGDAGVFALCGPLARHPTLATLDLQKNMIGDKGMAALAVTVARGMPRLQAIKAEDNAATVLGKHALGRACAARGMLQHVGRGANDTSSRAALTVVWEGGAPAEVARALRADGILVEDDESWLSCKKNLRGDGICVEDAGKSGMPPAEPAVLPITQRAWSVLARKGDEASATRCAVRLALVRHAFLSRLPDGAPCAREVRIVGISGPSGSGKSTLAKALARTLGSPLAPIQADMFFDSSRMRPAAAPWDETLDYERSSGLSWAVLVSELQRLVEMLRHSPCLPAEVLLAASAFFALGTNVAPQPAEESEREVPPLLGTKPVVIVLEGFVLFTCAQVAGLCDTRLLLEERFDTCLVRRWQRDGSKSWQRWCAPPVPDVPPLTPPEKYVQWFREVVWAAYEEQLPLQTAHTPEVLRASEEADVESLVARVAATVAAATDTR